ncbi:hypothetical protein [Salinimicrobium flavum]|uniref:Secreted protein n=1 Tax=Salinimicrobium flavum TaxID=1737065 RepID=A0ABW5IZ23_9FLAO
MKNVFFLICIIFFSHAAMAQIDNPTTTVKAPEGLKSPQTGSENSSLLRKPGNHSLSNKKGIFSTTKEPVGLGVEEKKPLNMTTDNGLMKYKEEDFAPKAFKDKDIKAEYRKDQYLGDIKTGGEYVELYCRDHEYVDGDIVRVYLNGEIVHNSVTLSSGYHPILVRLNRGFNQIEFEALNQGTSGPNTAELKVFDDKGLEVAKKEWNLLTGAKASLIVVKQ